MDQINGMDNEVSAEGFNKDQKKNYFLEIEIKHLKDEHIRASEENIFDTKFYETCIYS